MRKTFRTVGIVFLVLAGLVLGCKVAWEYANRRSAATLREARASFETDIERNLPLGTDESRAIEFLSTHGMRYDKIEAKDAWWHNEPSYHDAAETVEAITTTKISTSLYDCNMFLELKFDEDKKLIGYRDKMPCAGPWG
jgi:hypothetical protein